MPDETTEILNWISPIDYASHQSDFLRTRQPGTCQWLLDSEEFQTWLKTSKQTLFCPGILGAGKTILTSVVVEDLSVRFSNDPTVGIAYIYCSLTLQSEQKVEHLLASLLRQLAEKQTSLTRSAKDLYDSYNAKGTRPSLSEISAVLDFVASMYSRVFIIIDAVDECQISDRTKFLAEIFNLRSSRGANVFVTSRIIPGIVKSFRGSISRDIRASKEDVERYLEGHMGELPSFVQQDLQIQEEIKSKISEAADGMFLLARIYLTSLQDKLTLESTKSALEGFERQRSGSGNDSEVQKLSRVYEHAMERILGQPPDNRQLAEMVLSWITCAKRQLTASELQHALAVTVGSSELGEGNLMKINDMVSVCAGLVIVNEGVVGFAHRTMQGYFKQTQNLWFADAQTHIASVCITYLSFAVFQSGFCQTDREFEQKVQSYPLYGYAAHNWGHHARESLAMLPDIASFLENEAKVEASAQALMARDPMESNYSQKVPRQMTGLHLAAYFGVQKVIDDLLHRKHPDIKDSYSRTPLSYAAENGHDAIVKLLLEKNAEIETADMDGRTPLSWASGNGRDAVVKLLLENNADIEATDSTYIQTPLSWAATNGCDAVVKLLLENNASIEAKDFFSRTPLFWAAGFGHDAVVKLLLEKNAEIDIKDTYTRSPLSMAAENGRNAVVKLLLEKNADIETTDSFGRTPLSWAAMNGREAVVKLLLEKNADIETKDSRFGRTPLSWAAEGGWDAVVKLLLENSADVEAKDSVYGKTPLSWAAEYERDSTVKLLQQFG